MIEIDWLAQLGDEDRARVIGEAFGKVAATEEGQIVFGVLLVELFFFRRAETAEQQALTNFAKHLVTDYFGEQAQFRVLQALIGGKPNG